MIPEAMPDALRLAVEPLASIQRCSESIDAAIHSDLDRADFTRALRTAYVGHLQAIEIVWRNMPPMLQRQWRDALVDLVSTRLCPPGMHSDFSSVGIEFAKIVGRLRQDASAAAPAIKIEQSTLVLNLFS